MPPRRTNQKQMSVPAPPPVTVAPGIRRSRRPQHAAPGGESFDLANISGSEDEEEDQSPEQLLISTEITITENEDEDDCGINNPDIIVTRDSKNQAEDIQFFYDKLPDNYRCKVCKYVSLHYQLACCLKFNFLNRAALDADPGKWDRKVNYLYSSKSSTTTLRPHIEKYHLPIYLVEQKARGWKILLPGLVSQARSQATSTTELHQGEVRDKFSEAAFHRHLINFIVADDQVCFLVWVRFTNHPH